MNCALVCHNAPRRWLPCCGGLVLASVWLALTAFAWHSLWRHAYSPSKAAGVQPSAVSIAPTDRFSILLFAHPFCPCTRASLDELGETLTRLPPDAAVCVVFVTAGLPPLEVEQSPLLSQARTLPGVTVRCDDTGKEAARLGATVSGETFGFDSAGQLAFHGGMTPGRGHQGDAVGQAQLEQLASGLIVGPCLAPVYGCRLPSP